MALVVVIVRMFEIRSEVIKDCRPILQLLINLKNCTGIAVLVLFFMSFFVSLSELSPCPVSVRIYTSPYGGRVHRNQRYG